MEIVGFRGEALLAAGGGEISPVAGGGHDVDGGASTECRLGTVAIPEDVELSGTPTRGEVKHAVGIGGCVGRCRCRENRLVGSTGRNRSLQRNLANCEADRATARTAGLFVKQSPVPVTEVHFVGQLGPYAMSQYCMNTRGRKAESDVVTKTNCCQAWQVAGIWADRQALTGEKKLELS